MADTSPRSRYRKKATKARRLAPAYPKAAAAAAGKPHPQECEGGHAYPCDRPSTLDAFDAAA